jgi:hypothetical protein
MLSKILATSAGSQVPDRDTQDKSRTSRPVEMTRSAAISARWRSVHFWTARCEFREAKQYQR